MPETKRPDAVAEAVAEELRSGASPADAIARVAEMLGVPESEVGLAVAPAIDQLARTAAADALAEVQRMAGALLAAEFARLVRDGSVAEAFARLSRDLRGDDERKAERAAAAIRSLAVRIASTKRRAEPRKADASDLSVVAEVLDEVS
jgi:hypothetical protein